MAAASFAQLVCRASSGVPFVPDRWFCRYMPVWSDARDGPQGTALAKWLANSTPSRANASSAGVRTVGWPRAERHSARHWSAVMKSTFSGAVMAGSERKQPELALRGLANQIGWLAP